MGRYSILYKFISIDHLQNMGKSRWRVDRLELPGIVDGVELYINLRQSADDDRPFAYSFSLGVCFIIISRIFQVITGS